MLIDRPTASLPVSSLPLVGPAYVGRLATLDIHTIIDLLHHYPFRYDDLSLTTTINTLQEGETVTLVGQILSITNTYLRTGKTLQKAVFSDGSATLPLTWFNQPFLVKTLTQKPHLSISGKVVRYRGHLTLQSPKYETVDHRSKILDLKSSISTIHTGRLVPIYHETSGVSSKWLRSRLKPLLDRLDPSLDWLPPSIRLSNKLLPLTQALKLIHFPANEADIRAATLRLSFDELFLLQLAAQIRKLSRQHPQPSCQLTVNQEKLNHFIHHLPFTLTSSQTQALNDIVSDLAKPIAMNRLLQGDVGSGKTVVAVAAIYLSYLNHLPAVFMAPTQILAAQHFTTLKTLLEPYGVRIHLITQGQPDLSTPADLYLGTHALLYRPLPPTLGIVVIDEQHRFGVQQRSVLLNRPHLPNLLSMTATPIPRTIALTLYAELDLSVLQELPHGRLPVKTWLVPPPKRTSAYAWITTQITQSHAQVFIVCPLIQDSPFPLLDQVKAAETEFKRLQSEVFPRFRLGLLHGRLKTSAKTVALDAFRAHLLDILVSTPVIEVGIDIPQATIMVIEAAERFGLAQLHQLRGRVGRGSDQSYCLLFATNSQTSARLHHLTTTYSGLRLAELDLKLRGPGDIYGTQQSGYLNLKIASLSDQVLIHQTYQAAQHLLQPDPSLHQNPLVQVELQALLAKPTPAN